MSGFQRWKLLAMGCVAFGAVTLGAGCSYSGDTSGYNPKPLRTKVEVNRSIAEINANATMPAGVKAMALKQLNQELASAK